MIKCTHWWIIEEARGETSRGKCKLCHAVRIFPNSADYNNTELVRSLGKRRKAKKQQARI